MVKITDMNGIYEVYSPRSWPEFEQQVKKISRTQYAVIKTGEIKDYQLNKNRAQNTESLRRSFKKIRNTINANFFGKANELMVTLTYAENMTDRERLYCDFKRFMTRFRRKYGYIGKIEYISITEPQARGAWHCHILFKFVGADKLFIPNKDISNLWGNGFTKTKAIGLGNIDNIGAYLSAYLGDIPIEDDPKNSQNLPIMAKEVEGKEKKFIKGGRLHLYPTGMNIMRSSRGIIVPEAETLTYQEAKKIIGKHEPTYISTVEVRQQTDDYDRCLNVHNYEFYNVRNTMVKDNPTDITSISWEHKQNIKKLEKRQELLGFLPLESTDDCPFS